MKHTTQKQTLYGEKTHKKQMIKKNKGQINNTMMK